MIAILYLESDTPNMRYHPVKVKFQDVINPWWALGVLFIDLSAMEVSK